MLGSPECQATTEYCGRNSFPVPTRRPRSLSSDAPGGGEPGQSSSTRWGVEMSVGGAVGVVGAWWCCVLARGLGARLGGRRPGGKAAEAATRRGSLFLPRIQLTKLLNLRQSRRANRALGFCSFAREKCGRPDERSLFSFHCPPESCRRMRPDRPRNRTPVIAP